jgi:hypothetical protein
MAKIRLEIEGKAFILQGNKLASAKIFPEPKPFVVLNPKPVELGMPQTVYTQEEVKPVETGNLYISKKDGSVLGSKEDITATRGNFFLDGQVISADQVVMLVPTDDGKLKKVRKYDPTKVIKSTTSKWLPITSIGKWIPKSVYIWHLSTTKADYNQSEYARTKAELFSVCEEWFAAKKGLWSPFIPRSKPCVSIWYPYIEKQENGLYKFAIVSHNCDDQNENYPDLMEYAPTGIQQQVEILEEPDTSSALLALQ